MHAAAAPLAIAVAIAARVSAHDPITTRVTWTRDDGYAFVAESWQHGDPFFQQYVSEARAALKRLSGENSGVPIPVRKP